MSKCRYPDALGAIVDLHARGYEYDFTLLGSQLLCPQHKILFKTTEYDIVEMYYFRAKRCKFRERMIYAIEVSDYCIKGVLLITGDRNTSVFPLVINDKLRYHFVRSGNRSPGVIL